MSPALQLRIPTNVTGGTDERDRWMSADAWCSNSTLIGHDDQTQGCPYMVAPVCPGFLSVLVSRRGLQPYIRTLWEADRWLLSLMEYASRHPITGIGLEGRWITRVWPTTV